MAGIHFASILIGQMLRRLRADRELATVSLPLLAQAVAVRGTDCATTYTSSDVSKFTTTHH